MIIYKWTVVFQWLKTVWTTQEAHSCYLTRSCQRCSLKYTETDAYPRKGNVRWTAPSKLSQGYGQTYGYSQWIGLSFQTIGENSLSHARTHLKTGGVCVCNFYLSYAGSCGPYRPTGAWKTASMKWPHLSISRLIILTSQRCTFSIFAFTQLHPTSDTT